MSTARPVLAPRRAPFDVWKVREDFPILQQTVYGKPLVYLDNAATTQKPRQVIDRIRHYYERENANVHRGIHRLSEMATTAYEGARKTVQQFLNAREDCEIIFVRGTTEGINLVAHSYGRSRVGRGDEIVISAIEHHSNIVPWQMLCEQTGAVLRVIPANDKGELDLDAYRKMLNERTRLVAVVHISNALGTINPVREMIRDAHRYGIPVLVDGAQGLPHTRVNVQELDCDFYAFSGHKVFGPTGIGVLYGKRELLESLPPFQGGGDMIVSVSFEKTVYNVMPYRFEAGTPDIAGAVGLASALDYVSAVGHDNIAAHERDLLEYATARLTENPRLRIIGNADQKAGVISFVLEGVHPHDIGTIIDREGVAIRTGHHCTQPVMQRFGVPATARASFAFYNTREEVDALERSIHKVLEVFG
jgi:cysteine desulfurase/selenocysteine lyase